MEPDFFGHLIHLFGVVALTVVEYVPCLQFVHEILPMINFQSIIYFGDSGYSKIYAL